MATETRSFNPLILGHRVRFFRKRAGLTLDQLGELVGKPAPYLSNLENGKREPRIGLLEALAEALSVDLGELLRNEAPDARSALEIALERAQADPLYQELNLPHLRSSRNLPDEAITHCLALFESLRASRNTQIASPQESISANQALRERLESVDMYFGAIEAEAADCLKAVGFDDPGPVPESVLGDLAKHLGWQINQVGELPPAVRALADGHRRRILIRQRDELRTRQARTVILQTLGHFVLGHQEPASYADFLERRMEANYFAGAILAPEHSAVPFLRRAQEERRLSVEDLKEVFYVGYRMAAHRFTNLATAHLGLRTHFVRSDDQGVVWRAYGNNGVPFPIDESGAVVAQRLCRQWGTRAVFHSEDKYGIHYQYTDTPNGTFWCATHIEVDRQPSQAVTVGVEFADARWFRGRDTERHTVSQCPDGQCCRRPPGDLTAKWQDRVWVSLGAGALNEFGVPHSGLPGIDMAEIYEFADGMDV